MYGCQLTKMLLLLLLLLADHAVVLLVILKKQYWDGKSTADIGSSYNQDCVSTALYVLLLLLLHCCCWPSHYPFGQYYPVITQPLALVWCTYLLLGNRFCWPSPVTSACSKFIYVIQAVRSAMFVCAPHYCEEINCSLLHK